MNLKNPLFIITLLALLAFIAGCGSGDDVEALAAREGLNKPPPIGTALFTNTAFVDYIPGNGNSEAATLEAFYLSQGYPLITFTGITVADFVAATQGKAVLAIPENEAASLDAALDASARSAIADFVAGGGTLLVFYPDTFSLPLVNSTFGFGIGQSGLTTPVNIVPGNAVGTVFEAGPATLPGNSATTAVSTPTLPPGARVIYADAGGNAVVTVLPYGKGRTVILGWDWFDALPLGVTDGGWLEVLRRATPLL